MEMNVDMENSPAMNKKKGFDFNRFVIRIDSSWKGVFDFLMLLVSCQNIFANSYYAAFGLPTYSAFNIVDYIIEFLFMCDLLFCFCQEYLDEETYSVV